MSIVDRSIGEAALMNARDIENAYRAKREHERLAALPPPPPEPPHLCRWCASSTACRPDGWKRFRQSIAFCPGFETAPPSPGPDPEELAAHLEEQRGGLLVAKAALREVVLRHRDLSYLEAESVKLEPGELETAAKRVAFARRVVSETTRRIAELERNLSERRAEAARLATWQQLCAERPDAWQRYARARHDWLAAGRAVGPGASDYHEVDRLGTACLLLSRAAKDLTVCYSTLGVSGETTYLYDLPLPDDGCNEL